MKNLYLRFFIHSFTNKRQLCFNCLLIPPLRFPFNCNKLAISAERALNLLHSISTTVVNSFYLFDTREHDVILNRSLAASSSILSDLIALVGVVSHIFESDMHE